MVAVAAASLRAGVGAVPGTVIAADGRRERVAGLRERGEVDGLCEADAEETLRETGAIEGGETASAGGDAGPTAEIVGDGRTPGFVGAGVEVAGRGAGAVMLGL